MVTIKDVAKEAGVAISTVSNVINNVNNVRPETARRVLAAIETLKYVPNSNARSLKSGKKHTIGLFLSSIQGDFYRVLMQSIHRQCKQEGYMLNIYVSNENTGEEIYGMIMNSGVEGAIIMNESLNDEYIDYIAESGMPLVFLERDCRGDNISSIVVDNYSGAEMGMEYLVGLGHCRIGYIHGLESRDDRERFQAYRDVMNKYHFPINEKYILHGEFDENQAFLVVQRMIQKGVKLPDAFFCANDGMAGGCMCALAGAGIAVPQQVSVIGFDNISLSQYFKPALTTIDSPVEELGRKSTLELMRLMKANGEEIGIHAKLSPVIIERHSCRRRDD